MLENRKKQRSESYMVGLLLTLVGGYLDAYTYVCRGGVFANAQTGNMVLLGIRLAEGHFFAALHYLVPILTFFVGACFVEFIRYRFKEAEALHWRQVSIAIETIALAGVAFMPQGRFNDLVIIIITFVCSLQAQSFRKFNGNVYVSTMCTGNLRSAGEHFFIYENEKDKHELKITLEYLAVIAFFVLGAALGCFFSNIWGVKSIFVACIVLLAIFILMIRRLENEDANNI